MVLSDLTKGITGIVIHRYRSAGTLTSMGTGGSVQLLVDARNFDGLMELLRRVWSEGIPWWILGGGTNVLIPDEGVEGVVLRLKGQLATTVKYEEGLLTAGAGIPLARFLRWTKQVPRSGDLYFLAGIPGTLGGAVAVNAGTRKEWICEVIEYLEVILPPGRRVRLMGRELEWGYRYCRLPEGAVVYSVALKVRSDTLETKAPLEVELRDYRKRTQPHGVRSAGSFFKNPDPLKGPFAGALIDQAGLKGYRMGDAMVSPVHANFIVNIGNATTAQVLELAGYVRRVVQERFGVLLEPEVRLLGGQFTW